MRIGITGHQELEDPKAWDWVKPKIEELLAMIPRPVIGITCLAVGADSLFARVVLQQNGSIEVVLPFPGYELKLQPRERDEHRRLLNRASTVTMLERGPTDEESYFEAGKRVVDRAELLIAVWDGKPAKGLGGTADIIEYASQESKDIIHLDPIRRVVTSSSQR